MIQYSDRFKRAAALFMAAWFFASAGLVHSLHRHALNSTAGGESLRTAAPHTCGGHDSSPRAKHFAAEQTSELDKRHSSAYCLACLLINTCNSGAVEWAFEPHYLNSDGLMPRGSETVCLTSHVSLRPSRAPPVFTS